jgi:hypothetical protein
MLRLALLLAAVVAISTSAASAQTTIVLKSGERAATPAEQVRVSVGVNMFVAAPNDNSEQTLKAQEGGRRMIYEIAGRECALLREALASECQIESLNINVQHVPGNQMGGAQRVEGFNINGNIGLRIAPK